ncbi:unnamed protein product, partial [Ixodes hexagonus]
FCSSYSQFKSCVSEPLLRLCGNRARTIMDHSMAFLIDRCGKSYYSLSYKCPRARALPASSLLEASPSPDPMEASTSTRRPKKSVVSLTTWYPRTVLYTVAPTPSSQVSHYSSAQVHRFSGAVTSLVLMLNLLLVRLS